MTTTITAPDPVLIETIARVLGEHTITLTDQGSIKSVCLDCKDVVHDTGAVSTEYVTAGDWAAINEAGRVHVATHVAVELARGTSGE